MSVCGIHLFQSSRRQEKFIVDRSGDGAMPSNIEFQCEKAYRVQNPPSTGRPSFTAANHVVTLTRVTNERVVTQVISGTVELTQLMHAT